MSNRFLKTSNSGSADISGVSDGSIAIYGKTLAAADLIPDFPVMVNADRELYSTGSLTVIDLETSDTFSLNDELQKIDNFTASVGTETNIEGLVKVPEIAVDRVYDSTQSTYIELDGATVAVSANDLTLNGFSVLTGSDIAGFETKTQNINASTVSGTTDIDGYVRILGSSGGIIENTIELGMKLCAYATWAGIGIQASSKWSLLHQPHMSTISGDVEPPDHWLRRWFSIVEQKHYTSIIL